MVRNVSLIIAHVFMFVQFSFIKNDVLIFQRLVRRFSDSVYSRVTIMFAGEGSVCKLR